MFRKTIFTLYVSILLSSGSVLYSMDIDKLMENFGTQTDMVQPPSKTFKRAQKAQKLYTKFCDSMKRCIAQKRAEHNSNAYRDCCIEQALDIASKAVVAQDKRAISLLALSELAHKGAQEIDTQLRVGESPQHATAYQKFLYNQRRAAQLDISMDLNMTAVPARLYHKTVNFLTEHAIGAADKLGITDKSIQQLTNEAKLIAYAANKFIKQTFPEYINQKYTQWASVSKEKYHQWEHKLQNLKEHVHAGTCELLKCSGKERKQQEVAEIQKAFTQELAKLFKQQETQLTQQLQEYTQANQELYMLEHAAQPTSAQIARIQWHVQTLNDSRVVRETMADAFEGLACVAYCMGNNRAAQQISTLGSASIKIFDSMDKIVNASSYAALGLASASKLALINPYVGIATGVASLVSLFAQDDADDTGMQELINTINNAIMGLSRQIAQFHEHVMQRFDTLENKLEAHHRALLRGFFALHQVNQAFAHTMKKLARELQEGQQRAQIGLNYLHGVVQDNQQELLDAFRAENLRDIEEGIQRALYDIQSDIGNNEKFEEHVKNLYIQATVLAKQPNVTGSALDPKNFDALDKALSRSGHSRSLWGHPALTQINLLQNYSNTLDTTDHQTAALVNPLIWIRCTETLIDIISTKLEQDPHYFKNEAQRALLIKRLSDIADQAEVYLNFVQRLGNPEYLRTALTHYQTSLQELIDHIKQATSSYENKKTQELQASHRRAIEAEKLAIKTAPKIDHVTKAAERARNSINLYNYSCKDGNPAFDTLASSYGILPPVFRWNPKHTVSMNGKRLQSTDEVRNKIVAHEQAEDTAFTTLLQQKGEAYTTATQLKLFEQNQAGQDLQPLSNVLYPEAGQPYTVPLRLPDQTLPIPTVFVHAERQGLGKLCFEYKISNALFHLFVYFIDKNGSKTLLIDCATSFPAKPDVSNEDIVNYWNYSWQSAPQDHFTVVSQGYVLRPVSQVPVVPEQPYPGARETFFNQASVTTASGLAHMSADQENTIKQAQARERIIFNHELTQEASAPGSLLYKLLQKLDVHFKILDSLLTLVYNEQCQEHPEFVQLHAQNLTYAKNRQAILHYLEQYAHERDLSLQHDYLPAHLERTAELVQALIRTIANLGLQPQFLRMQLTLTKLHNLIHTCKQQVIAQQPEPQTQPLAIGYTAQDIAALIESNKTLQQEVVESRNETKLLREQMQQMQAQMQAMMTMLSSLSARNGQ